MNLGWRQSGAIDTMNRCPNVDPARRACAPATPLDRRHDHSDGGEGTRRDTYGPSHEGGGAGGDSENGGLDIESGLRRQVDCRGKEGNRRRRDLNRAKPIKETKVEGLQGRRGLLAQINVDLLVAHLQVDILVPHV